MFGKQNKHILWFSILLLFGLSLSSCDKGNEPLMSISKDSPQEVEKPMSPLLSNQEAVAQATKFYKLFAGEGFRSFQVPKVKEVIRTNKSEEFRSLTMGEMQKAGLLIVNFEKDKGFAIMSENRYGEPLLGISTSGNLNEEATQANPNLQFVLGRAMAYAYTKTPQTCKTCGGPAYDPANLPPPPPGQVYQVYCTLTECKKSQTGEPSVVVDGRSHIWDIINQVGDPDESWRIIEEVHPMLKTKWGQRGVYNNKVPLHKGKECPVGCVAVAVGQIMSHYRYPDFDWDTILKGDTTNAYFKKIVPAFLAELGSEEYLKMRYTDEGSSANSKNVPPTLRKYGYNCSDLMDYDFEKIKGELKANRVVYIRGNSFKKFKEEEEGLRALVFKGYAGGHAWVLDGFKIEERVVNSPVPSEKLRETKKFVACNFGWDGKYNSGSKGYYLSEIFNPKNKTPELKEDKENPGTFYEGAEKFYQFNLEIITGISR